MLDIISCLCPLGGSRTSKTQWVRLSNRSWWGNHVLKHFCEHFHAFTHVAPASSSPSISPSGLRPGGKVKLLHSSSLLAAERWAWWTACDDSPSLPASKYPSMSLLSETQLLCCGHMIWFVRRVVVCVSGCMCDHICALYMWLCCENAVTLTFEFFPPFVCLSGSQVTTKCC